MDKCIYIFIIFYFLLINLNAQSISQWRGPERNGRYESQNILNDWKNKKPEKLWLVEGIGKGFSSVSVGNGKVYITGMKDSMDYLSAIDFSGKLLWQVAYGKAWNKSFSETRSTPTIDGRDLFVISGQGEVVKIDAIEGKIIWSVNALQKFEGRYGKWGVAESPLITDKMVIYTPGGMKTTMVALDRENGKTIWTSESLQDTTAYVSPVMIEYANEHTIINVTAKYIFGINPENGEFRWKYKYYDLKTPEWHPVAPVINCNSPLYKEGKIYVTSGYNHVGAMFQINDEGNDIDLVWCDSVLDCHIGGVVEVNGYIYGSNWLSNRMGNWCCIHWDTGKKMYETEWKCKGSIITAGNNLYCYEEKSGHMAIVEATPNEFLIKGSFRIEEGSGPYWSHPVIHKQMLFLRHGDVLLAYNIGS